MVGRRRWRDGGIEGSGETVGGKKGEEGDMERYAAGPIGSTGGGDEELESPLAEPTTSSPRQHG